MVAGPNHCLCPRRRAPAAQAIGARLRANVREYAAEQRREGEPQLAWLLEADAAEVCATKGSALCPWRGCHQMPCFWRKAPSVVNSAIPPGERGYHPIPLRSKTCDCVGT